MDAISAVPPHQLLQRKHKADDHETRPGENATAAAFSSYGFGPLEMNDGKAPRKEAKPVNGASLQNPLSAHSLSWVTTVQAADSSGTNTKTG